MVLTILHTQKLRNWFNHLYINQPVYMIAVNHVRIPFEGEINPVDPTGIKVYFQ